MTCQGNENARRGLRRASREGGTRLLTQAPRALQVACRARPARLGVGSEADRAGRETRGTNPNLDPETKAGARRALRAAEKIKSGRAGALWGRCPSPVKIMQGAGQGG